MRRLSIGVLAVVLALASVSAQSRKTGDQHRQYTFVPTGQQMPLRVFVPPLRNNMSVVSLPKKRPRPANCQSVPIVASE